MAALVSDHKLQTSTFVKHGSRTRVYRMEALIGDPTIPPCSLVSSFILLPKRSTSRNVSIRYL